MGLSWIQKILSNFDSGSGNTVGFDYTSGERQNLSHYQNPKGFLVATVFCVFFFRDRRSRLRINKYIHSADFVKRGFGGLITAPTA